MYEVEVEYSDQDFACPCPFAHSISVVARICYGYCHQRGI